MTRTEKVLRLPSVLYRHEISDKLFVEINAFVGQVQKSKYIFLSKTESIVVEQEAVSSDQLPPDVTGLYMKIEGSNAFVEVKNRCRFKNLAEVGDRDLNSVVIQASNPVAVRALEARVRQLIEPQRFMMRTIFYSFPLVWFWISLVLIWFGEYRIARLLNPHLLLSGPLSALGAIAIFAVALGTTLVYANILAPVFSYWFPYFEIEDNLSTHRIRGQLIVGAICTSLAATGIWNLFSLFRT